MKNKFAISITLVFLLACSLPSAAATTVPVDIATATAITPLVQPATDTDTQVPTLAPPIETITFTPLPPTASPTSIPTDIPIAESLKATVTADTLSCRYGPGAEYLYFYGFYKGQKIELVGRTNANNWVMVSGLEHLCWVNKKFIEIEGDPQTLKITYPGEYTLPVSPYYAPPAVLSATRSGGSVTVEWTEIALRPGDEEDADMFIYIIEVWRCEGGETIFDPLASNYPEVTFVDEAGCSVPSHGRVFFQEKHGFAGPAEIPWPAP